MRLILFILLTMFIFSTFSAHAAVKPINIQLGKSKGAFCAAQTLAVAESKLGARYHFNAPGRITDANKRLFDCSQFVAWTYAQRNIKIGSPPTLNQLRWAKANNNKGVRIVSNALGINAELDYSVLQPGDLMYFRGGEKRHDKGNLDVGHAAIYYGNHAKYGAHTIIHASGAGSVRYDNLDNLQKRSGRAYQFRGAFRVCPDIDETKSASARVYSTQNSAKGSDGESEYVFQRDDSGRVIGIFRK